MKIKLLVAAVAMAAASNGANAAISADSGSNGELFLSVYDASTETSYSLDLGLTVLDMFNDDASTRTYDLSTDANFQSFLDDQTGLVKTGLVYHVVGFNSTPITTSVDQFAEFGLMTTTHQDASALEFQFTNASALNFTDAKYRSFANRLNVAAGSTDAAENLSTFASLANGDNHFYNNDWGNTLGGSGFNAASDVDTAVAFYHVSQDPATFGANQQVNALAGTWLLSSNASLTYSAVPVPAAVWLFGSGLLGLAGIARRKKA